MQKVKLDQALNQTLILTPQIGARSEIWIDRQANYLEKLVPVYLTWQNASPICWKPKHKIHYTGTKWAQSSFIQRSLARIPPYKFLTDYTETKNILRQVNKIDPKSAICHFTWTAIRANKALRLSRVPYITILHGLDLSENFGRVTQTEPLLSLVWTY
jgi:hypothetical protein